MDLRQYSSQNGLGVSELESVLWLPSFDPALSGHGGVRRSFQLTRLLEQSGLSIIRWPARLVSRGKVQRALRGLHSYYIRHNRVCRRPNLGRYGLEDLDQTILNDKAVKLVVVENTRQFASAIPIARRVGKRVIAMPQNVESLVMSRTNSWGLERTTAELLDELDILRQTETNVCIAREEQWLLRGFGLAAEYLPYYPPKEIRHGLEVIRNRREKASLKHYLILGYAGNIPNRMGMAELLSMFNSGKIIAKVPSYLVGFHTDLLSKDADGGPVKVLGGVTDEVLADLLSQAIAVVIHQRAGAGSLTKIPEMLVAGVPVIASEVAARSNYDQPGLYVYANANELGSLLLRELPSPPPPPPPLAEQRFVDLVRELASAKI